MNLSSSHRTVRRTATKLATRRNWALFQYATWLVTVSNLLMTHPAWTPIAMAMMIGLMVHVVSRGDLRRSITGACWATTGGALSMSGIPAAKTLGVLVIGLAIGSSAYAIVRQYQHLRDNRVVVERR